MTTILQGPHDPENFRVTGPYGSRLYTDPLPVCDIADESDDTYPSISKIKKAAGGDWSFVTVRRIAEASDNDYATLARLPAGRRGDALKSITNYGLKVDAGRGTIVHWWGEDLLNGRDMRDVDVMDLAEHGIPPAALKVAERYKPALLDFFEAYQPRLIATEFVVIKRPFSLADEVSGGWGGTPDGLWMLDKPPPKWSVGPYAFDYKSRGPNSKHGAYPDEASQIAAGVTGDYMIVDDGHGEAVRQRIPEVAGGMVVSIKPDGARVYPVDIEEASRDWLDRLAWFESRKKERAAIGRVWPIKRASV